ncbi:MAG UNVERIFIED_CONTAM: hypothetical protein LVR18_37435 [Planctomycetaceae bacterium]
MIRLEAQGLHLSAMIVGLEPGGEVTIVAGESRSPTCGVPRERPRTVSRGQPRPRNTGWHGRSTHSCQDDARNLLNGQPYAYALLDLEIPVKPGRSFPHRKRDQPAV